MGVSITLGDPMNQPNSDRRSADRAPMHLPITVAAGFGQFAATTSDLSPTGVFVPTTAPLEVGAPVRVHLNLGNSGSLRALGTVRRRVELGRGPSPGVAVEFTGLYPGDQGRLQRAVSNRRRDLSGAYTNGALSEIQSLCQTARVEVASPVERIVRVEEESGFRVRLDPDTIPLVRTAAIWTAIMAVALVLVYMTLNELLTSLATLGL